jgi:hypothetical protein
VEDPDQLRRLEVQLFDDLLTDFHERDAGLRTNALGLGQLVDSLFRRQL